MVWFGVYLQGMVVAMGWGVVEVEFELVLVVVVMLIMMEVEVVGNQRGSGGNGAIKVVLSYNGVA